MSANLETKKLENCYEKGANVQKSDFILGKNRHKCRRSVI